MCEQATLGIWLALNPNATPFERQIQGILSSNRRYPWWRYNRDRYVEGPVMLNELAYKIMMIWNDKLSGKDEHMATTDSNVIPFDEVMDTAQHDVAVYGKTLMYQKLSSLEADKEKLDHEINCLKDALEKAK